MEYRVEEKYICNAKDLAVLESRLKILMKSDENANQSNEYTVRSLYFDDYFNSAFYNNEDGLNSRCKYRLRYYNNESDKIKLEVKRKLNTYTNKISSEITRETAEKIIKHGTINCDEDMPLAYRQMYLKMKTDLLKPVVVVEYVRQAYVFKSGNVRITLDKQIKCSSDTRNFLDKCNFKTPILPTGQFVLEVKYDEFLPVHIYNALGLKNLNKTAFSKYYLSRLMLKNTFYKNGGIVK